MKRILFALLLAVTTLGITSVAQASTSIINLGMDDTSAKSATDQSLFQTIADYQNMQQVLLGLEIELRQEEERDFEEDNKIAELSQKLKEVNAEIVDLENSGESDKAAGKRAESDKIRFLLEENSQAFNEIFELHLQKVKQTKSEIEDTEIEIEKLKELAKSQALGLLIQIGIFIGVILFILLLRFISGKMIGRLSGRIPVPRSRALHRLNKIVFNVLIAIMAIAVVFSQALSILPVLAILGTAFAFALRNVISSFIAWFVIGTEQGYKIGDLIEIQSISGGSFRGRVLEVHPLITVLRQTGLRGDTGQILTFPNKVIFEDHIRNFSKMYRFTYIMIEFLVEDGTDVEKARELLIESINESLAKDIEEATKNLPNLQTKFGITKDQIDPQVFVEPDPKGLMLRGKYFCRLDSRHSSRTEITRHFLQKIRDYSDIKLRFVQFGDNH